MTMSRAVTVPPPRVRSTEAHAWLVALLVAGMWLDVLFDVAAHSSHVVRAPWLAALAGLAGQLAFTALEAAVAAEAWRLAGATAAWRSLVPRLLTVSSAEAFAVAIAAGRTTLPQPVAMVLAGARAAPGAAASGPTYALSGFGALAVVRLLLSAHAQAGVARVPYGRALLLVLALYLATRIAMWWSLDLMQGRSFQP